MRPSPIATGVGVGGGGRAALFVLFLVLLR
jgi:hypothetical protein